MANSMNEVTVRFAGRTATTDGYYSAPVPMVVTHDYSEQPFVVIATPLGEFEAKSKTALRDFFLRMAHTVDYFCTDRECVPLGRFTLHECEFCGDPVNHGTIRCAGCNGPNV